MSVTQGHRHRAGADRRIVRASPRLAGNGSMKRAISIRNVAKGAGAVMLGLVALDLIATAATLAIGAQWLKR